MPTRMSEIVVQAIEQPTRADDVGAGDACPLSHFAIGGHERHRPGAAGRERGERVVTYATA